MRAYFKKTTVENRKTLRSRSVSGNNYKITFFSEQFCLSSGQAGCIFDSYAQKYNQFQNFALKVRTYSKKIGFFTLKQNIPLTFLWWRKTQFWQACQGVSMGGRNCFGSFFKDIYAINYIIKSVARKNSSGHVGSS